MYKAQEGFTAGEIKHIDAHRTESQPYCKRRKTWLAPKYVVSQERSYNPYDYKVLRSLIDNKHFSEFLNRQILNTEDVLSHTNFLVDHWLEQDRETNLEFKRQQNRERQTQFRLRKIQSIPELEEAKQKWKDAVAQRDAALAQWEAYVEQLRHAYNVVKLNSSKGVKNEQ